MTIDGIPTPQPGTAAAVSTRKVADAAAQFETLIITQMLQSSAASGALTSMDGEEASDDAVSGFAAQQLGQALANAGGLGLARLVASGLGETKPRS